MAEDKKAVARSVLKLIMRDLGKYGNYKSGVNKYFHLMNVIDSLRTHLIVNYGDKWFVDAMNKELSVLKGGIYERVGNWKELESKLEKIRPKLDRIQMHYDEYSSRKNKDKSRSAEFKKLINGISPYQTELFLAFNILMKITDIQWHTIPAQAFVSPDLTEKKDTFKREIKSLEKSNELE